MPSTMYEIQELSFIYTSCMQPRLLCVVCVFVCVCSHGYRATQGNYMHITDTIMLYFACMTSISLHTQHNEYTILY